MKEKFDSFLFKYGGYIIYLVFLIGFFLNGALAISYFGTGRWLFGILSLFSIVVIPKASLGFILLLGRNSLLYTNIPPLIRDLFRGTMQRYWGISQSVIFGTAEWKRLIKETIWLGVGFLPFIAFLFFSS